MAARRMARVFGEDFIGGAMEEGSRSTRSRARHYSAFTRPPHSLCFVSVVVPSSAHGECARLRFCSSSFGKQKRVWFRTWLLYRDDAHGPSHKHSSALFPPHLMMIFLISKNAYNVNYFKKEYQMHIYMKTYFTMILIL